MELNDTNIKKIRWLVVFTVAVVVIGVNYKNVFAVITRLIGFLTPFMAGAAMAFILNVPMRAIEKRLPFKKKAARPISLILSMLLVVGILLVVTFVVTPQLVETVMSLQYSIPAFLEQVRVMAEDLFAQNPEILEYINSVQIDWKAYMEQMITFLSSGAGTVLSSTFAAAMSIVNGVTTFVIGLVFAIYILLQKETLGRQFIKLGRAFLPDATTDYLLRLFKLTSDTFTNFLTGQCVEAVILGTMFFVTLTVLRLPYALLIGVLIAFTALIPVFGAFIGCVIGAFLMLVANPLDAAIFVVVFLILQQIEGDLIYPHVVGNSVGLPPIWVLVAVTIGGSAMGIIGMLIFIPVCSVFYAVLREVVYKRLEQKKTAAAEGRSQSKQAK